MSRKYIPWFWRLQESCPDCGWVGKEKNEVEFIMHKEGVFKCPQCGVIYSCEEFWEEYRDRYSFKMKEEDL